MAGADRLIEVFTEAKSRPAGAERDGFLAATCQGDVALKEQVLSLLQAHEGAGDFLKNTIPSPAILLTEKPGDRIGRYKLLEQIGEGGCGVVYMAEQEEPVRRRVALKVIKLGMDTKQVVARFEAERQALALMDHPNIAKVFDAGATDTGRPYFVMELVRGIKITDYCDQAKLNTTERLDLFIKVCQAVQHAHQKGIIHRDLKPSNILVAQHDTVAVPKIIDFGIAKATSDQPLTDKTVFTAFEQFIGTPAYMSPEQAQLSGLDIDTRTDIYSLGVLLYELLTGQTPFDPEQLMKSGVEAMRRTIREKEPARPSTRLTQELVAAKGVGRVTPCAPSSGESTSTGGAHGVTHPTPKSEMDVASSRRLLQLKELVNLLRGDLDWIVMKCLEKERTRRYETANGLAMDLQRHLNNEPVVARPPSAVYRFQKLVRRNRGAAFAVAAVVTVLVLGALVSTWQAFEASRARDAEKQERRRAVKGELAARTSELATRQKAYASDMNLAQQALAVNNLGRALERLNRHRLIQKSEIPSTINYQPPTDLRGWEWRYLWQQCQSDAHFTLCQKSNPICSLAVSPDGNWLAVGEQNEGRLSIWDLQKKEEIMRFPPDDGPFFVVFSPRERLLAFSSGAALPSVNRQYHVQLWDGNSKQIVAKLPLADSCRGLAFSDDGQTLVTLSAGEEGQLTLWKVPEGTRLATHPAGSIRWQRGSPFAVAGDLSMAAYALFVGEICAMDLRTGKERWTTNSSDENVTALAFSPDGKILASGEGYGPSPIRLWDVASGQERRSLEGHRGFVSSLVFSPDGKTLASASGDQTIRVWDLDGARPPRTLLGHQREVWSLALLPDNRTLVSGCEDGSVSVWDTVASRRESSHVKVPEIVSWSFATNGHTIFTCDQQGRVAQRQGNYVAEERLFDMGTNVARATFLPHRSEVMARLDNGQIHLWDLQTRSFSRELPLTNSPPHHWWYMVHGNRLIIGSMARESLEEWDLTSWEKVRTWRGPAQHYTGALSPDGRWCVSLGYGGASMVNDLTTGHTITGKLEIKQAMGVTFSPDGKLLAAASDLGFARIWDTATLKEIATLRGFLQNVWSVAFSPDGRRLATGSDAKEAIKLWGVESHEELLSLESEESRFDDTAFSPDGTVLGSLNKKEVLHLWRSPSWEEIEAAEKAEAMHMKETQPR